MPQIAVPPPPAPQPIVTIEHDDRPPVVRVADKFFNSVDGALVALVMIVAITLIARTIQARLLHGSVRKAIESDSPHAADMIGKINQPYAAQHRGRSATDARVGIVLTAIGLAMAVFGALIGQRETAASSVFPLFVGIGLLINHRIVSRAPAQE